MRKLMLILLALCLAVMPCLAEGSSLMEYDFGDFTLTFPSDTVGEVADEIKPNEVFFTLFQDYSDNDSYNINMNGVWTEDYQDLARLDAEDFGNDILGESVDGFESAGIIVENPALLDTFMDKLGGKSALFLIYSYDLDYVNLGYDLKTTICVIQAFVSDPNFGTYAFTITTPDMDSWLPLAEILDTIEWKY